MQNELLKYQTHLLAVLHGGHGDRKAERGLVALHCDVQLLRINVGDEVEAADELVWHLCAHAAIMTSGPTAAKNHCMEQGTGDPPAGTAASNP